MESITGTVLSISGASGYDSNGGDFDILRDLLITADAIAETPFAGIGLVAALDTVPDLTVFAPADSAFMGLATTVASVTGNIAPSSEAAIVRFLADTLTLLGQGDASQLLTDILTYHVTPGVFELDDVVMLGDGAAVPTLLGVDLVTDFDTMPASLIDGDGGLPNPGIIATDIGATNGVIHVLDGVLLPVAVSSILTAPDTDFVIGANSAESIKTKDGNDFINGKGGNDEIKAGYGDDVAIGGAGNDYIVGGAGADVLIGGVGRDDIFGGQDNDMIQGGAGNDQLYDNTGDDIVEGGTGNDLIVSGGGNDVFVFNSGDGNDRVVGFRDGHDMIDLSGYAGIDSFADIAGDITSSGLRTMIDLDDGDSIMLLGINGSQLDASDFIFA
ncbi:fasciclin domain-containing protein [Phaeobacter marinintestinus]|uniref:fasciclin domain-containing protein n=1 Tax=Falsiphaeobacter marinintestinus TaxID=1492905 RepID=UPI0011B441EA|nr:fasciclin domain-containing protein [Phaeobacter marinintestinus]